MSTRQKLAEGLGWYGTLAIASAYVLVSFKIIPADGGVFQLLNLSGAIGIIIISTVKKARQPMVLNIFWAIVAAVALVHLIIK